MGWNQSPFDSCATHACGTDKGPTRPYTYIFIVSLFSFGCFCRCRPQDIPLFTFLNLKFLFASFRAWYYHRTSVIVNSSYPSQCNYFIKPIPFESAASAKNALFEIRSFPDPVRKFLPKLGRALISRLNDNLVYLFSQFVKLLPSWNKIKIHSINRFPLDYPNHVGIPDYLDALCTWPKKKVSHTRKLIVDSFFSTRDYKKHSGGVFAQQWGLDYQLVFFLRVPIFYSSFMIDFIQGEASIIVSVGNEFIIRRFACNDAK